MTALQFDLQYMQLFENLLDGIIVTDLSCNILYTNQHAQKIFAEPQEKLFKKNLYDDFRFYKAERPENKKLQIKADKKTFKAITHNAQRVDLINRNGDHICLSLSIAQLNQNCNVITIKNINSQIKLQEQHKFLNMSFDTFFESTKDPMIIFGQNYIKKANKAFLTLMGYEDFHEIKKFHPLEIYAEPPSGDDELDSRQKSFKNMLFEHGTVDFDTQLLKKNQETVSVNARFTLLQFNNKIIIFALFINNQ